MPGGEHWKLLCPVVGKAAACFLPEVLVQCRPGVMWAWCASWVLKMGVHQVDSCQVLFFYVPQLRRSPIKKVRKSLALDILDEDTTQNMPALPKTVCFKRAQVRGTVLGAGVELASAPKKPCAKQLWELCHLQLPLNSMFNSMNIHP